MNTMLGNLQGMASLSLVLLIVTWELAAPARNRPPGALRRWTRNYTVGGIGILLTHAIPGGTLLGISAWGKSVGIGVLQPLPTYVSVALTALVLDLALWAQHRASHEWKWLWRLHQVHHGDRAMDLSTAFRFHPLELLVSLMWKSVVVLVLGGPTAGVLLFEGLLLLGNLFEHANGHLPHPIDRVLRWVMVTPHLHAIHHSVNPQDQKANFGFFLTWWDRALSTLQTHTKSPSPMVMGLGDNRERTVGDMLLQPFEPSITIISGATRHASSPPSVRLGIRRRTLRAEP